MTRRIAAAIVFITGIVLAVYFLIDDTPEAWLIRLSYAGAITAGVGFVVYALAELVGYTRTPPT